MTALTTYRQMVLDGIHAAMPELKEVAAHPGRFDLGELKRIAMRAPAVRMAILGGPRIAEQSDERLRVDLACALFVITRDAPGLSRDEAALNITEALIRLISLNQWQITPDAGFGLMLPREVQTENLYSGEVDKRGVALWGIHWRQELILGESAFAPGEALPAELYVRFEREDPQPRLVATGTQGGG